MAFNSALFGQAVFNNSAFDLINSESEAIVPIESLGYVLGPGFDIMFYVTINRGLRTPTVSSIGIPAPVPE